MRPPRLLLCALALLALALRPARADPPVTIFAAASLKAAMADLSAAWAAQGHAPLRVSLGSSGTLARQIAEGAPAELFISADQAWMDHLDKAGLVVAGTRRILLTNSLVLVAPAASTPPPITLAPGVPLAPLLGAHGRLAVGDPASVPAGIYARQALTRLGAWNALAARLAPAEDVKAALRLVDRAEAPAGIVYATDAQGDAAVKVLATFPADSHDPIVYPVALVGPGRPGDAARAVLAFLEGPQAARIFAARGFGVR